MSCFVWRAEAGMRTEVVLIVWLHHRRYGAMIATVESWFAALVLLSGIIGTLCIALRCMMMHSFLFVFVLIFACQEWNGSFFKRLYLCDLGLRIQLNHPPGSICQWRTAGHKNFVVLHTNGIHLVNVDFCGCSPTISNRQQLLRTSWWPATPLEPRTCATFALLNQFHLLSLQGKTSAFDFYRSLQYITENHSLEKLPVSNMSAVFVTIFTAYRLLESSTQFYADDT